MCAHEIQHVFGSFCEACDTGQRRACVCVCVTVAMIDDSLCDPLFNVGMECGTRDDDGHKRLWGCSEHKSGHKNDKKLTKGLKASSRP